MATDLGGEVSVKTKPLEMDTENLRKTNDTHLLEAVLKAEREGEREREKERERERERERDQERSGRERGGRRKERV